MKAIKQTALGLVGVLALVGLMSVPFLNAQTGTVPVFIPSSGVRAQLVAPPSGTDKGLVLNNTGTGNTQEWRQSGTLKASMAQGGILKAESVSSGTIVDVKGYGATGDGVTNDAAAIQAAVDVVHAAGGGTVYYPPGNYILGTTTINTYNNITHKGIGAGHQSGVMQATTITYSGTGSAFDHPLQSAHRSYFEGFLLAGTAVSPGVGCVGINFRDQVFKCGTNNLRVTGFGIGIAVNYGQVLTIIDTQVVGPQKYGLYINEATDVIVRGGLYSNANSASCANIYITGASRFVVVDVALIDEAFSSGSAPVWVQNGSDIVIRANTIFFGDYGVRVGDGVTTPARVHIAVGRIESFAVGTPTNTIKIEAGCTDTIIENCITDPSLGGDISDAGTRTKFINVNGKTSGTTYNGLTVTPTTGTLTIPNGVTLTGPATSGTALISGGALGTPASGTLTNCTGLPPDGISSTTGTGAVVRATGPTMTTPNIGAATGTSVVLSGNGTFNGGVLNLGASVASVTSDSSLTLESTNGNVKLFSGTSGLVTIGASDGVGRWAFDMNSAGDLVPNGSNARTIGSASALVKNIYTNGVTIGGGTTIAKVISATGTLDFGSISAGATAELDLTVTGTAAGDSTVAVPSGSPESGLVWSCYGATDKITVRVANVTGSPIDPASRTWRGTTTKF